jgi:phage-related protein
MAYRNAACARFEGRIGEVRSSLPSQRIARLILCFREGTLIVLHGFIKKTQKTPTEELGLISDGLISDGLISDRQPWPL